MSVVRMDFTLLEYSVNTLLEGGSTFRCRSSINEILRISEYLEEILTILREWEDERYKVDPIVKTTFL